MGWLTRVALLLAVAFTLDGAQGQVCNSQVDLMMVVDGSSGLTNAEYEKLKDLVIDYVRSKSETSAQSTLNAGYIVVSENVDAQLAPTTRFADFADSLDKVPFTAGRSLVTSSAIETAFSNLLNANSPRGTPKIMIVLESQTSSNQVRTRTITNLARQYSTTIWGVGLKNMDPAELLVIAGDQNTQRTLPDILNAATLPSISLNLQGVDCGSVNPTVPPTTQRPTTPSPTTPRPTTPRPTTPRPTTPRPTTPRPTTPRPTTPRPTTPRPTTPRPTTPRPTTPRPSTPRPTTPRPSTPRPTTPRPTTQRPTTPRPSTPRPTTQRPTTPVTTIPTIRTTREPTSPPTTRRPTTLRPLETDSLCQDAVIVSGVGIRGHPTDPGKYIQCYFPQFISGSRRRRRRQINTGFSAVSLGMTNTLAVIRQCQFGLFWNQPTLTCNPAASVAIEDDVCSADGAAKTRAVSGSCRGYYMCVNGRSVPMCCPQGYAYSKFGCLACPSCMENCILNGGVNTYACNYQPVWNKPDSYRVFRWNSDGGSYVEQQCADGCYFNLATCDCAFKPWTPQNDTNPAPVCQPSYTIGLSQVGLGGGNVRAALENDDSFANYGGPMVLEFRYREAEEIVSRHALLSSTECPRAGFLLVTVDRESILVEVTTESGVLTSLSLPTVGFKPDQYKTLRLVDNNDFIMATVTDGRDGYTTRVAAPASPYLQCGLDIGTARFVDDFRGAIDNFLLYKLVHPRQCLGMRGNRKKSSRAFTS